MNNREKATLIWLGIGFAAALRNREIRGSLWDVVKAFFHPQIIAPLLVFAGWTVGLVALAGTVGLWEAGLQNDAIAWFVTVGIVFCFSLERVTEEWFFRKTFRRTLAVTAFVEAFVNLAVFGLAVELVLLPALTALVAMATFTQGQKAYAAVNRLMNLLLTAVGACAFGYVLARLAADFDAGHVLRALILPVWLTIGSLPFVYVLGLWAEYERAFLCIKFRAPERANRRRAKLALLLAAHVRASELAGFSGHWISDLVSAESFEDARAIMRQWRATWRDEQRASRMSSARAFMCEWLTEANPTLAEVHGDALRRSWGRLDSEQRSMLKAEGMRLASPKLADAVRALPV